MLELQGVTRRFGALTAVDGCDLVLERGRTTVLIGPSGCGKSTLLRLMIGLERPDAGTVCFDGKVVRPEGLEELRRRFGYVIQDGGLFPHLRAGDNVALLARHLGWSEERIAGRIGELAELTHFPADALARYPGELSGGQKQRVALMRALMMDPEVLLLDEPLGALDPMIRYELQRDLKQVFAGLNKTVVLVTHDLAEAGFLGDTIVLLRDGRIVQKGELRDMLNAPADEFVQGFVRAQRSHLSGGDPA